MQIYWGEHGINLIIKAENIYEASDCGIATSNYC